jgi:hypothetical protein
LVYLEAKGTLKEGGDDEKAWDNGREEWDDKKGMNAVGG